MTVLKCMYIFVYLCDIFLKQVNVLRKKYFSVLFQVLRIYVYMYSIYMYVCVNVYMCTYCMRLLNLGS